MAQNKAHFIGTCETHKKLMWESRKHAKAAARAAHPGDNMCAYECSEHQGVWHYGHLHSLVISRGIDMGAAGRH